MQVSDFHWKIWRTGIILMSCGTYCVLYLTLLYIRHSVHSEVTSSSWACLSLWSWPSVLSQHLDSVLGCLKGTALMSLKTWKCGNEGNPVLYFEEIGIQWRISTRAWAPSTVISFLSQPSFHCPMLLPLPSIIFYFKMIAVFQKP